MDSVHLGLLFRALRRRRSLTQVRLTAVARVSRSTVQLVERGGADDLTGSTLWRIAVALGTRFDQRLRWRGEALDRLLDQDHARLVEHVVRWLRGPAGTSYRRPHSPYGVSVARSTCSAGTLRATRC